MKLIFRKDLVLSALILFFGILFLCNTPLIEGNTIKQNGDGIADNNFLLRKILAALGEDSSEEDISGEDISVFEEDISGEDISGEDISVFEEEQE